jgi:hypothetical protein
MSASGAFDYGDKKSALFALPLRPSKKRKGGRRMTVSRLEKRIADCGLGVGLGLAETENFVTGLPLAPALEDFDALEALQDVAFCGDGAGTLETAMLRHKIV